MKRRELAAVFLGAAACLALSADAASAFGGRLFNRGTDGGCGGCAAPVAAYGGGCNDGGCGGGLA